MALVYVADADKNQGEKLAGYLRFNGFSSESFFSLSDLQRTVQKLPPDIIVMELDYQDGDGLAYLRKVCSSYPFPVVVASERSSESDRIISFEFGCDDYVVKPYSMKELSLRLFSILKRKKASGFSLHKRIFRVRSSELIVDWDSHLLLLDGRNIVFTASEWKILTFLADNAGSLVTRQQVLSECFPECLESSDRIIDTHIKNMRGKLGVKRTDWIETVRGYGYRFLGHEVKF